MGGIILAFKKFRVDLGIFDSPWVGFENFEFFFTSSDAWRVVRNTLGMNFLFILFTTVFSVLFAVMMYRLRGRRLVKTYHYMPAFCLWWATWEMPGPIDCCLVFAVGILAGDSSCCKAVAWCGYNSLFYYASLMGIDKEYFEAAQLDGATKSQELRYIILPFLKPLSL